MQQVLNEVGQIAQRLAGVIWQVLQFIWNWSFGQVVKMFQVPFNNLPLWKQVLFVLVIAALGYFLYKVAKDLLKAVQSVLGAIVGLHLRAHRNAAADCVCGTHRLRWRMGHNNFESDMDFNCTALIRRRATNKGPSFRAGTSR